MVRIMLVKMGLVLLALVTLFIGAFVAYYLFWIVDERLGSFQMYCVFKHVGIWWLSIATF